jgi:FkbM family methyltransferase
MTQAYQQDLIYDVGLNTGQDAEFYLKKGFRVVGIEANPAVAKAAAERLAKFGSRLTIINRGIGPRRDYLKFYVNRRHHEQSTFLSEYTTGPTWDLGYDEIIAPVTSINTVLAEHGVPYYMKVDIEAWDMLLLSQLAEISARPHYISVETGPNLDWINALEGLGYTGFKLVNQHKNKDAIPPCPAKEGRYAEHCFEWGSSGLFGEEIEGPWLSADQVRHSWRGHINTGFPDGDWFDIHARIDSRLPRSHPSPACGVAHRDGDAGQG